MTDEHPTRRQILDAAVELFAHKGYANTGMDEIAREVGITKPAIYHYFAGKEKLFHQLLEEAHREHHRILDELNALPVDLHGLLIEMSRRAMDMVREKPAWMLMMIRLYAFPMELRGFVDLDGLEREHKGDLIAVVSSHMGGHRLRDGLTMDLFVDFFAGLVNAYLAKCLGRGDALDDSAIARALGDLVYFGAFVSE